MKTGLGSSFLVVSEEYKEQTPNDFVNTSAGRSS